MALPCSPCVHALARGRASVLCRVQCLDLQRCPLCLHAGLQLMSVCDCVCASVMAAQLRAKGELWVCAQRGHASGAQCGCPVAGSPCGCAQQAGCCGRCRHVPWVWSVGLGCCQGSRCLELASSNGCCLCQEVPLWRCRRWHGPGQAQVKQIAWSRAPPCSSCCWGLGNSTRLHTRQAGPRAGS